MSSAYLSFTSMATTINGDALNAFFVNNLNPERFPKTQLWIHGHVHTPFDYLVPAEDHEIRVVCNPWDTPCSGLVGASRSRLSRWNSSLYWLSGRRTPRLRFEGHHRGRMCQVIRTLFP